MKKTYQKMYDKLLYQNC